MPEEDLVDIKFRLYDGSDLGPFRYSSASTVDMLKQRIVSDWPKGKTIIPKAASEVKLINSGKILENNKTVGQCKMPFGDNGSGVIIMHVVVQPSLAKTKTAIMSSLGVTQFCVELDWTTNMGHVKSFLQCTSQGQALISLDDVPSFFSFFPEDFSLPKISFLFMFFEGFLLPKKLWSNPLQIEIDFPH